MVFFEEEKNYNQEIVLDKECFLSVIETIFFITTFI